MNSKESFFSLIFVAIIGCAIYGISHAAPAYIHPYTWYSWIFFSILHFLVKAIAALQKGVKASRTLITVVYGGVALKLFAGVAYILFFLAQKPENAIVFVVNFFILYFLFSGFEIYVSLANLRAQSNK